MRATALVASLLLGVPLFAAAESQVNSEQLKYDQEYSALAEKLRKSCNQIKNYPKKSKCWAEASSKARESFPARGTDEYAQRHYGALTPRQAEQALMKLRDQHGTASSLDTGNAPGVLNKQRLIDEGIWIHENVFRTRRTPELQVNPWMVPCEDLDKYDKTVMHDYVAMCPLGSSGRGAGRSNTGIR